jgi:hypothetical protein
MVIFLLCAKEKFSSAAAFRIPHNFSERCERQQQQQAAHDVS